MYRFLLTPKWLVGIVLAASATVVFVLLGFWQLARHEEREAFNHALSTRLHEPPVSLEAVAADPDAHAYRRVAVRGVYEHDREVLLAGRSLEGRAGHHVLTPLRTAQGTVVVNRGWVPLELTDPPLAEAAPPPGELQVEGVVFPGERAARAGAAREGGRLRYVSAVDLAVLGEWVGGSLLPVYVLAQHQDPPSGRELPVAAPLPEVEDGPHFSYAIQWFVFAGVVAIGFPLLVRSVGRDRTGARGREASPA